MYHAVKFSSETEFANDMLKVPIPVPLLHSIVTINLLKERKLVFLSAFKFEEPITLAQYKSSQSTAAYSERLPSRHVPHPHKQDDGSLNTEKTHEIQALHFRQ
jgi:hypothetical protein